MQMYRKGVMYINPEVLPEGYKQTLRFHPAFWEMLS